MGSIDFFHSLTFSHSCLANPITKSVLPSVCFSWAAKSYWENWITTLIDSATNLWFPMSAEPSALLSSPITHCYLAGLPIHTAAVPTTPSPDLYLIVIPLNLNTGFHLLLLRTLRLSGVNSFAFPPLCLQIYLCLYSSVSHFVSRNNPYSFVHLTLQFSSFLTLLRFVSPVCFLFATSKFCSAHQPTYNSVFVFKSFIIPSTVKLLFIFLSNENSWQSTLHSVALLT